jgi:hypothetical protein
MHLESVPNAPVPHGSWNWHRTGLHRLAPTGQTQYGPIAPFVKYITRLHYDYRRTSTLYAYWYCYYKYTTTCDSKEGDRVPVRAETQAAYSVAPACDVCHLNLVSRELDLEVNWKT